MSPNRNLAFLIPPGLAVLTLASCWWLCPPELRPLHPASQPAMVAGQDLAVDRSGNDDTTAAPAAGATSRDLGGAGRPATGWVGGQGEFSSQDLQRGSGETFARSSAGSFSPDESDTYGSPAEESPAVAGSLPAPAVFLPLAMLDPAPVMQPTELQQEALNALAENFAGAVLGDSSGQPAVAPAPDELLARWQQQAQPASDEQYRLWFGWQATMEQQLQRLQAMASAQ